MRDINDDMDDLFRRAADNYPLNTNSSDWNKVQNAMQSSENAVVQNNSKKKYRRFLWLLLLLPFAFVIEKYAFQNDSKKNSFPQHQQGSSEQKNSSSEKIDSENLKEKEKTGPASLSKENVSPSAKTSQNQNRDEIANEVNENKNAQNRYSLEQNVVDGKDLLSEPPNEQANNDFPGKEDGNKNPATVNKDFEGIETTNKNPAVVSKDIETRESKNGNDTNLKEQSADTTDKHEIAKLENKPAVKNELKSNKIAKARKPTLKKTRPHNFYAGIVAGPDFSTVKLEKIIKTGYTLGLIAGYGFNKNLSIESGLLFDKKYYYSEGKYFDTKNVYLPYHAKIENVDGYCNMIELPLNLKYNFKSGKKVNWFVVTGVSSYFMSKESYDYRYSIYGQQKESNLSLNDNSKIWASVMNVGLGYSHRVGKKGTFRIEPYIKIPFKGVGVGSLPITSSGVYLGFTKNLF